jgi:hypothetical protein
MWALTCGPCEDILRSDPHWSSHPDDLPETPDEQSRREVQQRAGQREQQDANAEALQKLAGLGDLPMAIQQLAAIMTGGNVSGVGPTTEECPGGHRNPVGAKFCAECGASMLVGLDPVPGTKKIVPTEDVSAPKDEVPTEPTPTPPKAPVKKAAPAPARRKPAGS